MEYNDNYIRFINNFWFMDTEHNFGPNEIALYFLILKIVNRKHWKNPYIGLSNELTMIKFGIGKTAFDTAKRNLKLANLIDFKPGNGRGNTYQYHLKPVVEDHEMIEETKVDSKHTLSDTLSTTFSDTLSKPKPEASINSKQKLKYKKEKKIFQFVFRESEFFDKEKLASGLAGTTYEKADIDHYHEIMLNWSDSKAAKKVNWLATAKGWMARDKTEGKFITKDSNGISNAKPKSTIVTKGSTIDDIQALKRGTAKQADDSFSPGRTVGSDIRAEWTEATIVE